uniref:Zinc finger protein 532-like n=1 Tax=Saccoglossus kowalevskii TaxID=10224 RepID=A0ABM0GT45_SACKO
DVVADDDGGVRGEDAADDDDDDDVHGEDATDDGVHGDDDENKHDVDESDEKIQKSSNVVVKNSDAKSTSPDKSPETSGKRKKIIIIPTNTEKTLVDKKSSHATKVDVVASTELKAQDGTDKKDIKSESPLLYKSILPSATTSEKEVSPAKPQLVQGPALPQKDVLKIKPSVSLSASPVQKPLLKLVQAKGQIKIAPKPIASTSAKIVAFPSTNSHIPGTMLKTATTATGQRLLVITSVAQPRVSGTNSITVSSLSSVVSPVVSTTLGKAGTLQSALLDGGLPLDSSTGPTVNVIVHNNLLKRNNPVTRYVPKLPPKEWKMSVPMDGYRCLECGDAYLFESSLNMHLERCSLTITYVCEVCNKKLVFYNKCSLLRHVRLHYSKSAKNINVSLKSVEVSSLNKSVISLWPTGTRRDNQTSYQDKSVTNVPTAQPQCPECEVVFANLQSRNTHFQLNGKGSDLNCTVCGLHCPNKCYYQAHQRVHKNQAPYICPECGEDKHDRELFYVHLNASCFHFCRQAVYKCTHCNAGYPNITSVKEHLQNIHTDTFCKCPICPMAFKSVDIINNHMQSQHQLAGHGFRVIHKCPMCDTVFPQKSSLPSHLNTHLINKENLRIYVFKCNDCNKHFDSKETLQKHQQVQHKGSQLKDFVCDVCRVPFKTYQFMLQHKNKHFEQLKSPPPTTVINNKCSVCGKLFDSKADMIDHIVEHEKDGVFVCQQLVEHLQQHEQKLTQSIIKNSCHECGIAFKSMEALNKHMKRTHRRLAPHACQICPKTFESNKSLQRHIRVKHKGSIPYTCWHCSDTTKQTFSKRSQLKKHLQRVHGITADAEFPEMPATTAGTNIHVRKRRSTIVGNSRATSKRAKFELSSSYDCAKCSYHTDVRREFQEHIVEHKNDTASAQCKECGLLFRGDQSLKKHLYMIHKVKDFNEYEDAISLLEENGGSQKTTVAPSGSIISKRTEDALSLECNVCYKSFDNDISLRTHMRNHGMAFIKSKRGNSGDSS